MKRRIQEASLLASFTVLCAGAYALAFSLRFGGPIPGELKRVVLLTVGFVVVAKLLAFLWFGVHKQHHRYVSFEDLVTLAKAATASAVAITLVDYFLLNSAAIPRGVIVIDWGVTLVVLGAARAAPRALRYARVRRARHAGQTAALIVGANDEGEALLRMLRTASERPYRVVGFIDPDRARFGRRIGGVPVLGGLDELSALALRHGVAEVLITGSLPGRQVRAIVDEAREGGFRVKVLPTYDQLLREDVSISPREVAIEDLLRREAVEFDLDAVARWLNGHTVLVTGAAGSIGSEICRQLLRIKPARLVALDRSETGQFFLERELRRLAPDANLEVVLADLTDAARMRAVFERHRPAIIFHAAAYKHVPLMEQHPGEAVKNIALATRNLADLADEFAAAALVMISTDKAVNPTSVMGSCKKLAERYVQARAGGASCRFTTVRFGNVLDSAGSVVPVFREQIARGGPVTVTHPDIVRYFMMIPEAAQLVIQAGVMGQGGEIFVLDMGEPIKIMDLARDMIRLSGLREREDIEIQFTGLRPGEKLFEELYGDSERHTATPHRKIMVADSEPENLLRVTHDIGRVAALVNDDPALVRQALAEIVPLYLPGAERRGAAA